MIDKISFTTVRGDYYELALRLVNGSSCVEMQLSYSNGCQYARFKFEDIKKAVEILGEQDNGEE